MDSIEVIEEHIYSRDNPHQLTKHDIPGLEKIENFPVATVEEAEAGYFYNRYLTPRRLKSVFDGHLKRQGLMDEDGFPILAQHR